MTSADHMTPELMISHSEDRSQRPGVGVEGGEQGLGEGVPDDGHLGDPLLGRSVSSKRLGIEKCGSASITTDPAHAEHRHGGEQSRAVHERRARASGGAGGAWPGPPALAARPPRSPSSG